MSRTNILGTICWGDELTQKGYVTDGKDSFKFDYRNITNGKTLPEFTKDTHGIKVLFDVYVDSHFEYAHNVRIIDSIDELVDQKLQLEYILKFDPLNVLVEYPLNKLITKE